MFTLCTFSGSFGSDPCDDIYSMLYEYESELDTAQERNAYSETSQFWTNLWIQRPRSARSSEIQDRAVLCALIKFIIIIACSGEIDKIIYNPHA